MKEKQVKPFLKWAGGKTQLIDDIKENFIYQTTDEFSYVEPFVGSGAVLFWVLNNFPNLKYAVINDINEDLINSYKIIKSDVNNLVLALKQLEDEYYQFSEKPEEKKKYYYDKRELFNTRNCNKLTQASLFIFLNRTCFNGLYRVNKKNQFNVPIGSYKKPLICNEDNLKSVSSALQKVKFLTGDFEKTLDHVNDNSIFYLDPPYKPLSETSSFNSYAKNEFNDNEQKRLKIFCDKLNSLGHNWILSNSDVKGKDPSNEFFDELYEEYKINRVVAKRSINANPNKRGLLTELLITNQGVLNGV
jgi:DNA adenine methylase